MAQKQKMKVHTELDLAHLVESQKLVDKMNSVLREFLDGLPVIRAFSNQKVQLIIQLIRNQPVALHRNPPKPF